jgi:hypothetical protein
MTSPDMSPVDHDPTAFMEACRLAALDKAENPRFVRDRNGHAHWAAEYPHVFTFDGQLVIIEGYPGGALTHVIVETTEERILIRKTSEGVQSADLQTFVLTSTNMARQAAEQGEPLEPRPIATKTLAGVVLVPGTVMQLGYDPRSGTFPRSHGVITRITGLQMNDEGKVAPDALQPPETDAYEIYNGHLRSIDETRRVGGRVLKQIQIQIQK